MTARGTIIELPTSAKIDRGTTTGKQQFCPRRFRRCGLSRLTISYLLRRQRNSHSLHQFIQPCSFFAQKLETGVHQRRVSTLSPQIPPRFPSPHTDSFQTSRRRCGAQTSRWVFGGTDQPASDGTWSFRLPRNNLADTFPPPSRHRKRCVICSRENAANIPRRATPNHRGEPATSRAPTDGNYLPQKITRLEIQLCPSGLSARSRRTPAGPIWCLVVSGLPPPVSQSSRSLPPPLTSLPRGHAYRGCKIRAFSPPKTRGQRKPRGKERAARENLEKTSRKRKPRGNPLKILSLSLRERAGSRNRAIAPPLEVR